MNASHPCQVSELIFVRYSVDFRRGWKFAETLKRMSGNYRKQLADAYNAHNPGASVIPHQITILSISNGWK